MRRFAGYALAYLLALITGAAGMAVALWARSAMVAVLAILSMGVTLERFQRSMEIRALDVWSAVIAGLIVLILLVFAEDYYRTGSQRGLLWRRFCRLTAIEVGVLFVAHAIYFVVGKAAGVLSWTAILLPAAELLATALLAWLYVRLAKASMPGKTGPSLHVHG